MSRCETLENHQIRRFDDPMGKQEACFITIQTKGRTRQSPGTVTNTPRIEMFELPAFDIRKYFSVLPEPWAPH